MTSEEDPNSIADPDCAAVAPLGAKSLTQENEENRRERLERLERSGGRAICPSGESGRACTYYANFAARARLSILLRGGRLRCNLLVSRFPQDRSESPAGRVVPHLYRLSGKEAATQQPPSLMGTGVDEPSIHAPACFLVPPFSCALGKVRPC